MTTRPNPAGEGENWQCPKCKRWQMHDWDICRSEFDTGIPCDGKRQHPHPAPEASAKAAAEAETLAEIHVTSAHSSKGVRFVSALLGKSMVLTSREFQNSGSNDAEIEFIRKLVVDLMLDHAQARLGRARDVIEELQGYRQSGNAERSVMEPSADGPWLHRADVLRAIGGGGATSSDDSHD